VCASPSELGGWASPCQCPSASGTAESGLGGQNSESVIRVHKILVLWKPQKRSDVSDAASTQAAEVAISVGTGWVGSLETSTSMMRNWKLHDSADWPGHLQIATTYLVNS